MSYTKTVWNNDNLPYINANNLNKIEQGIYDNDIAIGKILSGETDLPYDSNTTIKEAIDTVNNALGYNEYSSSNTYEIGDYVIYNNILYVCITAITTPEEFDNAKWAATTIEELIENSGNEIETMITHDSDTLSIAGSATASGSITLTNEGYYPSGLGGINCSSVNLRLMGVYISSAANGTCTVSYTYRNTITTSGTPTITAYVNWIKTIR